MHIELKCFATLRSYCPPDSQVTVTNGSTVAEALAQLGIPLAEVKLIFINGLRKELDDPLENGDRLGIFPPVGGG